ncbi:hypothetical protein IX317_001110 [Fusobacterium sp. DD29]|uniref:ParA family protein n=1 Tax=unclassified Fusobacterium TaxID=2648384 RepID=UPI001B8D776C|nr:MULTISPECIES: ParA family protein [unclassified Fusobacterium]MBR8701308.1 hypothetical protein [Fusobacterium sp. DD45]MBR8711076.1 hypothetical protein [Fusobacterium sp. DD28]MBR8749436.1 hypothetical protein [Fusobacterium sp. DD29]MBR8751650.1 hypothetical protein [Fusobacterium sp. DD26]MBR8761674.1 hypothetical protein [Fusobacterium sp. DD25]
MAAIILIKANKGGVGKSWITLQLAHHFAIKNKKVLILTSDSQNNIPDFAGVNINTHADLEEWILNGNSELIELRNNLFYIPFHSVNLDDSLKHKFEIFIDTIKTEFDYIFIDSTPVLNLDNIFIGVADKIVIPTFLDMVTMNSILTLLDTVPAEKVKAIIPNRTGRCSLEKVYFESLKDILGNLIYLSVPIRQSALISKMIDQGKTIWESKSRAAIELQSTFYPVLEVIKNE